MTTPCLWRTISTGKPKGQRNSKAMKRWNPRPRGSMLSESTFGCRPSRMEKKTRTSTGRETATFCVHRRKVRGPASQTFASSATKTALHAGDRKRGKPRRATTASRGSRTAARQHERHIDPSKEGICENGRQRSMYQCLNVGIDRVPSPYHNSSSLSGSLRPEMTASRECGIYQDIPLALL